MAKADLGTKRTDPDTGKKFYDLNRDPVVSPYSGKSWPLSFFEESTAQAKLEQAEEEEVAEVDAENTEVELVSLEDADGDGVLVIEIGVGRVILRAELHARDVADADGQLSRMLDDDAAQVLDAKAVPERGRALEAAEEVHVAQVAHAQAGERLAPAEPWASMPNTGSW